MTLQADETAWSFWALRGVVHPIPKGFIDPRFGVRLGAVTRDRSTARSSTVAPETVSNQSTYTAGSFLLGMDVRCLELAQVGSRVRTILLLPDRFGSACCRLRLGVEILGN